MKALSASSRRVRAHAKFTTRRGVNFYDSSMKRWIFTIFSQRVLSLMLLFSLWAQDDNGWAPVAKPPQDHSFRHAGDEDDPSAWVIISKSVDGEKFLASFPKEPFYTHSSEGECVMEAVSDEGVSFSLRVAVGGGWERLEQAVCERFLEFRTLYRAEWGSWHVERSSPSSFDLIYQREGKWIGVHLFASAAHLYTLQTESPVPSVAEHARFVHAWRISECSPPHGA
jgi:hypothetical protein